MNNLNKDELLFYKRIKELAHTAYQKGFVSYTGFLGLNEINIFYDTKNELPPVETLIFGGYNEAERKVLCFYEKNIEETVKPPINIIKISPLNKKFSDVLTHRDFLGAILNLGIERNKIGDILIKENEAYVFVINTISSFIKEQLIKVKHTNVQCTISDCTKFDIAPTFREMSGTVSSLRVDAVLAFAFNSSRSKLTEFISGGKVFVNGRLIESNSHIIKDDDIVSVRGLGKFIFCELQNQTKKGRLCIKIKKYI